AVKALKEDKAEEIVAAQATVTKALWLHRDSEPNDLVMRAKLWHTVGECSFALGFLHESGGASGSSSESKKLVAAGNGPVPTPKPSIGAQYHPPHLMASVWFEVFLVAVVVV
ncbi:unnamed protein product, partial [Polarella glacialis]